MIDALTQFHRDALVQSALKHRLAGIYWSRTFVEAGEGQNLVIESRFADRQTERLPALAADLVRLNVDVIVTITTPAALAAKAATSTIPIVMAGSADPVGLGLVASLARPGGNVTGVTNSPGEGFIAKQLQLLKEAAPRISRVAVLMTSFSFETDSFASMQAASAALGVTVMAFKVESPNGIDLDGLARLRADALYVFPNLINGRHSKAIVAFAAENRLPAMYGERDVVEAVGLMSYWTNWLALRRHAAEFVDKILKGAKPADLPVAEPPTFVVGMLSNSPAPAQGRHWTTERLVTGLREAGLVEGRQLRVEVRSTDGSPLALDAAAAELVRLRVDAIVATVTPAAAAAVRATQRIPIVLAGVADPLGSGLVPSLARPGGNVTGVSSMGLEMAAKNLELLREWLPQARRVGLLLQVRDPLTPRLIPALERTARSIGLAPLVAKVADAAGYAERFAQWSRQRVDALLVQPTAHFQQAIKLALQHRLPSSSWVRTFPELGGLFAYGPDFGAISSKAADYIARIRNGTNPGDLPMQQPSRFDMVINSRTAQAIGLTMSPSLRLRATEVIE